MKRQLEDNPLLRHQSTMSNLFPKEKKLPLGKLRVNALERTGKMLPKTPLAEHKFLAPPTSGASNWVQIGPTAVPGGQMLSTYYYPNFSRERPTTA